MKSSIWARVGNSFSKKFNSVSLRILLPVFTVNSNYTTIDPPDILL